MTLLWLPYFKRYDRISLCVYHKDIKVEKNGFGILKRLCNTTTTTRRNKTLLPCDVFLQATFFPSHLIKRENNLAEIKEMKWIDKGNKDAEREGDKE